MISMRMSLNLLLKFSGNVSEVVSKSVHEPWDYPQIVLKLGSSHARTENAQGQESDVPFQIGQF